jgi:hypothetical protein
MDHEPIEARDFAFTHFVTVALCGALIIALALFLARVGAMLH